MMSSVRSKDTKLELEIRHRLFSMSFRYRLHRKDLPGKPDIVLPKYSAVVFINGCFWHLHGCERSKLPNTMRSWWKEKLEGNRRRDIETISALNNLGWRVLVVWECSVRRPGVVRTKAIEKITDCIAEFLRSQISYLEIPKVPCKRNLQNGIRD